MLGQVAALTRYPVKSLAGERLDSAEVDRRGLRGDRLWAVVDQDGKLGSGKSSKRFRKMDGLMLLSAAYDAEVPVIEFPDGRDERGDGESVHAALTAYVGRPVTLRRERDVSYFDDGPLLVVTTSSVDALSAAAGRPVEVAHMRPNIVLTTDADGYVEETWVGREIAIGDEVVLSISAPMPRCVMVTMPQVGVDPDPDLLTLVTEVNHMNLGVVADVVRPGRVAVGDAVRLGESSGGTRHP